MSAYIQCSKHGLLSPQCSKCFEETEKKGEDRCGGIHLIPAFPPHKITKKEFDRRLLKRWAETCKP